ncbi:MAG: shikimate dehydrogenase [Gammaproteobacteria bacterium]|nr:shikimate dehydrogenase [Gammaproteobacteria bacterium]
MTERKLNKFAVIGNPVAHSQSPYIHQAFARQFDVNLCYEKILTNEDNFKQVVEQFFADGGKGLNITTPFKSLAAVCAKRCTSEASASESVNTLYMNNSGELIGESTDGRGWLADIKRLKISLDNKNILMIGAGGAARVLINTIVKKPISSLHICNRTVEKAQQLLNDPKLSASGLNNIPDIKWDLVINTLSVGWHGAYPEIKVNIAELSYAYDLNYGDGAQPFRDWFLFYGGNQANFNDGWGMLVEQAAESFNQWWKLRPITDKLISSGNP